MGMPIYILTLKPIKVARLLRSIEPRSASKCLHLCEPCHRHCHARQALMDYDYYDESRTRFQLQAVPLTSDPDEEKKRIDLFEVGSCFFLALLCLGFAWYSQGFCQFSLLWLASALFIGPFAPPSATGGICRVGVGKLLPPEKEEEGSSETEDSCAHNVKQRRKVAALPVQEPVPPKDRGNVEEQVGHAMRRVKENGKLASDDSGDGEEGPENNGSSGVDDDMYDYDSQAYDKKGVRKTQSNPNRTNAANGDAEWTSADVDLLKKLMVRYPRGMLKRWEVIAESFDGVHSVESIVKMSKTLGEKKKSSSDSYSDFLEKRKGQSTVIASPLSQRWDIDDPHMEDTKSEENITQEEDDQPKTVGNTIQGQGRKKSEWTEAEDKALLSALKTFPKETPMRWEKVALAVPTRTKQQCFRRYTQLKESFRNKLEKS
ncbi:hypothetical protein GOP47_0028855 [Adiantum capillus-veneris]|nr:hypothetical protein GOP47_0028855 [Adiantum capillus-veneris]